MTAFRLVGCALLLSLPLLGHAQTTEFAPRYYVGLAVYSSDYQRITHNYKGGVSVPMQLTLGYQVQPRLAVQLGIAYSSTSYNFDYNGRYYYPTPEPKLPYYYSYSTHGVLRNMSLGVLARYTLTRKPTHHVQFDVLGGLSLDHARESFNRTHTDIDSVQTVIATTYSEERYTDTNFLLTAGLSTRYRFSQRLEAVLDVTLSRSFLRGQYSGYPGSTALGLRYRFGQR